jgi:hypothetical protein
MTINVKIDKDSIAKKIANSTSLRFKGWQLAERRASILFKSRKNAMLQAFAAHPVTQEIEGGTGASNISNTLGGYGNLFTFIGFQDGTRPTKELNQILLEDTQMSRGRALKLAWQFKITYPSQEKIEKNTPLPWESGNSWAYGIEKGISGFGQYMKRNSIRSRSGGGLQSSSIIRSGAFGKVPYISNIIEKFKNSFKQ